MIDPVQVVEGLISTSLWAAGAALGRAAEANGGDFTDSLGPFTAQTLDTDAIVAAVRSTVPEAASRDEVGRLLSEPGLQPLVHGLLTSRLLELSGLAETACPDLQPEAREQLAEHVYDWLDAACNAVAARVGFG
ncbi:MAG: hypothetical protein M3529_14195 [Actinomycetota bacterium]|nr:hypothetical protein [Actinomycetota bacterium]